MLIKQAISASAIFACAISASFAQDTAPVSAPLPPVDDHANWRAVAPENLLRMTINRQEVLIELRPDFAPAHVEQVRKITREGHYNSLPFHRVIDDFMAQGGEVSAVYMLSTPYPTLPAEFTFRRNPKEAPFTELPSMPGVGFVDGFVAKSQPDSLALLMADASVEAFAMHCPGITSMARADSPDSADTQFFLMRHTQHALDEKYTIWGRVLIGLDVVRGIKAGPDSSDGRMAPGEADKLTRAEMISDLPETKRPRVYVQRTEGPAFLASLETLAAGGPRDPCDLPPVPVIVERPGID